MRIWAPYGQVATYLRGGSRERRALSLFRAVGIACARTRWVWVRPGGLALDCKLSGGILDVPLNKQWLVLAVLFGRAGNGAIIVCSEVGASLEAFSLLAIVSLILGNSLREALSGTTWNRSHSGRPLSGVSPGGVLSCTELSRAAISKLISRTFADSSSALHGLGCSCLDARIVRIACSVCPHYLIAGVTGPPRR